MMVSMLFARSAQWRLPFVATLVGAVVATDGGPDIADKLRGIFADETKLICGGTQIHSLLTAHPSVDGIRNTPWSKIMAIASAYLQAQATEIPKLEAEVTRLIAAIASMEKKEAITPLTEEQLRGLITSAVTAPDTYGSVGNAVESKCGAADRKVCRKLQPPVKASAYKKSTAAFEAAAKALFDGSVKTDGASFRKVCDAMLPGDTSGTVESYCDELCQSFADLAQVTSDSTAGAKAGSSSDKLREQLQGKQKDLQYAMSEKSECETAKESLEGFMAQLEDLQKDIKVEFAKVQDAREALGEFEDQVFDLEDDLERQQGETAKAVRLAGEAGVKTQLAKAALEEVRKNEMSLKTQLKEAKNSLESAKAELEKAHQADIAVQQLRGLVSQTLLNMVAYVNEAVLEPVRRIGLGEDVEVNDRFAQGLEGLPTAGDFKGSVTNLLGYCQETALPAFKLLQAGVKLAPICEVGPVEKVVPGVFSAVEVRAADVKKHLKSVQSWLDPYKGQKKMNKDEAKRLVLQGEPAGLREVVRIFGQTGYYSQYLKRWKKTAKPSFLDLYAKLGVKLAALATEIDDLKTKIAACERVLNRRNDRLKELAAELEKAVKAQMLEGQKQIQAENALKLVKEEYRKAESNVNELKKALNLAVQRYEASKDLLEKTHHKGTSMLEQWDATEAWEGVAHSMLEA
mmetsp:Transcript_11887/g.36683  ORF Transcript_11887/g.36683 Transcript_11887/m.36683 type:complete len:686 (-) Transcript_11887:113-2170(-)